MLINVINCFMLVFRKNDDIQEPIYTADDYRGSGRVPSCQEKDDL